MKEDVIENYTSDGEVLDQEVDKENNKRKGGYMSEIEEMQDKLSQDEEKHAGLNRSSSTSGVKYF